MLLKLGSFSTPFQEFFMSSLLTLALQAATSLLCSLMLIFLLRTPLTRTLNRLCPDADAAAFWWAYATAMLVAAPLALVLMVNLIAPGATTVDQLRAALLTSYVDSTVLRDVIERHDVSQPVALRALVEQPGISTRELMQHIPAPDFPTGGYPLRQLHGLLYTDRTSGKIACLGNWPCLVTRRRIAYSLTRQLALL